MSQLRRRRDILKMSVLVVGALPTACYREALDPPQLSADESARYFPQSVASGDPRPDSVVLWTRVEDSARATHDLEVELLLATDEALSELVLLSADAQALAVLASADHCLRVQVAGLLPDTTYYYRFRYQSREGSAESRVGRTRTAPASESVRSVRFAVMCCQDYAGKYFHVARHIAAQDVDFVLHLGDYVYETAGDPSFQAPTAARQVVFSAPDEALLIGSGDAKSLAAQSLSNYRDLYKLYRSDPDLQALHERHPLIAIWDDHEFSDDCHGDVANYDDGRVDETSPERRLAADQAWAEYMPVDFDTAPATKLDKQGEFPDNFAIYRSFTFGQHLELVLTDLRRFRPDHLVPEDAAPGAVYLTAGDVAAYFDAPLPGLVPYVDIEQYADGAYAEALSDNAAALGIDAATLKAEFSAVWINSALASLSGSELPAPIDLEDATLERGYAYHCLLKTEQYSRIGARYVVAVGPFEALAKKRWLESKGASERLMGKAQREWFLDTIRNSTRTFKIWGSEVALQSRHIDLTDFESAPPELRTVISISAEDWDGFPNERRALLRELARAENVLILSGDLHCFFAGTPFVETDESLRVVELTTGSVTSATWLDSIRGSLTQGSRVPMSVQQLIALLPALLADSVRRPNPHLAYQELSRNGYSLVEVGAEDVGLTTYGITTQDVAKAPSKLRGKFDDLFSTERFRTRSGSAELEREVDGQFLTWDRQEMAFK